MRASFKESSSSDLSKSLTRSLFQGKFNLSDTLFERGLENGDFTEVTDKHGRKAYMWETAIHKVKQGEKQQVDYSASMQGEKGDVEKMEKFAKSHWKLGLFQKNPASGSRAHPPGQGQQLALCDDAPLDEDQWQAAQGQLKPAMEAFDKCEKDGLKMLNAIGPENRDDPLVLNLLLGCNQLVLGHNNQIIQAYTQVVYTSILFKYILGIHLNILLEIKSKRTCGFPTYGALLPLERLI